MDFIGRFQLEKKGGKPFQLVYHNPKYQSISKTRSLITFGEQVSNDHLLQQFFLCPNARSNKKTSASILPLLSSPEYVFSATKIQKDDDHHVVPLFQCNNKESNSCDACSVSNYGTNYYFCGYCDKTFHKECVESPSKIKNPKHPEHYLQLFYIFDDAKKIESLCCETLAKQLVYHCIKCDIFMHPICAMNSIPFVINQPKRHKHPLSLFPQQNLLVCSICGLVRKYSLTFICVECNFIAHEDCIHIPCTIRISHHQHRVSYKSDLQSIEWSCGVCRKSMEGDYGAYACEQCYNYNVHAKCALLKDVCDQQELEGIPEEDDVTQDASPFNLISQGIIRHFLHDHNLHLKDNILCDENKLCHMCVLPIFEAQLYTCIECDFIIHVTCAGAPRRIQHVSHFHPLTLKTVSGYYDKLFYCDVCYRDGGGFVYQCMRSICQYDLDVRCALISEPFNYEGHEHPLFQTLHGLEQSPTCYICKEKCLKQLNCIKCDFIICFKCSTLPYMARYKHEIHFLRVMCGVEISEKNWCEVCELNLQDTSAKIFYWCNECSITFHVECLFGEDPYMKPGLQFTINEEEVQILSSNNLSRPLCDACENPCQGKLFKTTENIACSVKCSYEIF